MTERRKGARGSGIWLALLLSVLPSFRRLSAQVSLQLSLGARYTSTMVHDSIVTPFDVRPAIAPVLAVSATTPLNDPWSAVATLDVSWSRLERHDQDGTTAGWAGWGRSPSPLASRAGSRPASRPTPQSVASSTSRRRTTASSPRERAA